MHPLSFIAESIPSLDHNIYEVCWFGYLTVLKTDIGVGLYFIKNYVTEPVFYLLSTLSCKKYNQDHQQGLSFIPQDLHTDDTLSDTMEDKNKQELLQFDSYEYNPRNEEEYITTPIQVNYEDLQCIYAGTNQGNICVWIPSICKDKAVYKLHSPTQLKNWSPSPIRSLFISPAMKRILSLTNSNELFIWKAQQ